MEYHLNRGSLDAETVSERANSSILYGFLASEIEPTIVCITEYREKGLYETKEQILDLARNAAFRE